MAIRPAVAISLRNIFTISLSLLCLKCVLGQQCLSSNSIKCSDGSQQSPKPSCSLNQANSGHNFNAQQTNMHQMNYQQPSNIQQASFMQQTGSGQPQWNLQQVSQPTINSISNSQPSQQQNQGTHTYSALQNIQPSQGTNLAQSNALQQVNSPTFTISGPTNKNRYQVSIAEPPQYQPTITFQPVHSKSSPNTASSHQNQQNNIPTSQLSYANTQNMDYNSQNQPVSNPASNQRATPLQNPIAVIVPSSANTPQPQPIILALQTPQMLPIQSPPSLPSQFGANQPIVYAVQTPSSASNQNQQIVPKKANKSNPHADDQSLMTYVMSQIQNQMGNDNALASILPSIINTKSEKSSLKALLPLLFNILNDRSSGCVCPHCGCNNNNNNNNNQRVQEPLINSGYSNKKIYTSQGPTNEHLEKNTESNDINSTVDETYKDKSNNNNDVINEDNTEASDEEEDEEEDSEEYDEDD